MSLYYNNFRYLGQNSIDKGLMVVSFEPDNGFMDSFLTMESIQDDYFDGTKTFDYGGKFSSKAAINVTVTKRNGTDLTLSEFRELARWLTGARVNSWLDVGPVRFIEDEDENIKYSFLCKVTDLQQYKLDGRTVGVKITFSSVSPWAYSIPQHFSLSIGENMLYLIEPSVVTRKDMDTNEIIINVDEDGVLYNSPNEVNSYFLFENGVAYVDNRARTHIDNQTDDLYTYIGLDIDYINETSDNISITNEALDEETRISNMNDNEIIELSSQQFIVSYTIDKLTGKRVLNENKIFGDNFNFVWPRLTPGMNNFIVDGDGKGTVEFSYRYPMKVGDCTIDIDVHGNIIDCEETIQ